MRFTVIKVDKGSDDGTIIVSCRSQEDGERHKLIVTDFKPYFYVTPEEYDEKVQDWPIVSEVINAAEDLVTGQSLNKISFKRVTDVRPYRTKLKEVWEADIPYTQRFILDTDCRGTIECPVGSGNVHTVISSDIKFISEDIGAMRKWYLDIEVANTTFCRPEDASAPVCAIALYDTFTNTMYTWAWNPTRYPEFVKKDFYSRAMKCFIDWEQVWCEDSADLLRQFSKFVNTHRPDVICGWNSIDYDMQYILTHAKTRRLSMDSLGGRGVHFKDIPEIQQLDMLPIFRTMNQGELKSATLGDVAREECGIELIKDADNIMHWFNTDPEALITYNALDVDATLAIDMKKEISEFALRYMHFVGVDVLMDIDAASIVVDVAHLWEARKLGLALPSRLLEEENTGYKGATVLDPVPGVHKNVAVLDFSRMYPSIIMGYNMSFETYGGRGIILPPDPNQGFPGATFRKSPDGLSASVTKRLAALRAKYDQAIQEAPDAKTKRELKNRRAPVKTLLVSIYGVLGFERYRLFKKEVAESVTYAGRKLIDLVKTKMESMGYSVVYGDTDSLFVVIGEGEQEVVVKKAEELCDVANRALVDHANTLGIDPVYLTMDFEKLYNRVFLANAKKRYAGRVTWFEGRDCAPWTEIKGFEQKRSDSAELTGELQTKVFNMLFDDKGKEEVMGYLKELELGVRSGKYPISEIAPCPKLAKEPVLYADPDTGNITWAPAKAAAYSMTYLNKTFRAGDRAYLVYVLAQPQDKPKVKMIALREKDTEMPKGWYVDWRTMAEKCVVDKTKRIISAMGWDQRGKQQGLF